MGFHDILTEIKQYFFIASLEVEPEDKASSSHWEPFHSVKMPWLVAAVHHFYLLLQAYGNFCHLHFSLFISHNNATKLLTFLYQRTLKLLLCS